MKRASQTSLNETQNVQRERFEQLKGRFQELLKEIGSNDSNLITPFWQNINDELARRFDPPPFGFLTEPELAGTMSSTNIEWAADQLRVLGTRFSEDELKRQLQEQLVGDPLIFNEHYLSSCNTVHHLYHFVKFLDNTDSTGIRDVHKILEIGGGYGRLPVMFNRAYSHYGNYTILDIPVFTCIQWLYLSCVYGEKFVNIVTSKNQDHTCGLFNLIPITVAQHYSYNPDMFVAMWSLSETSPDCLNYVLENEFFGAKKIFMGFHGNPDWQLPSGYHLKKYCDSRMNVVPVGFVENNYYGVK